MKKDDYLVKILEIDTFEETVHIRNIGPSDHVTICGLDGGIAGSEHKVLDLQRGDKMNCGSCFCYYKNRKGLNVPTQFIDKETNL